MEQEIAVVEPWYMSGWSTHPSPSGLGRIAACVRSEAMPHAHFNSQFARKGTIGHKFLADCLEHGRDLALGMTEDAEDIEWLSMLPVEQLPAFNPQSYIAEVALAYNPRTRTCREVGRNISREEARRRTNETGGGEPEIVGIIDICGQTDELAVAHDYKLGYGYVEPAEVNWQLRTYALFAARWLKLNGAVYSVIRARDNGRTWSDVAHMDELDLLGHEEAFIELLERREEVRGFVRAGQWEKVPPFVEGKHCRYCPAFAFCPAKAAGVKALMAQDEASGMEVISAQAAAVAWRKIKLAQKTLERWESVVRDLARQAPIPLEDDLVLGEKLTPKETIVPARAREALVRQYGALGSAVAGEATEVDETMTKSKFRAALKKLVLPTLPEQHQKITWLERDALKLLREAGAVSVVVTRVVCEHVPQPKAEEPGAESEAA